jgi:hypothetical protein
VSGASSRKVCFAPSCAKANEPARHLDLLIGEEDRGSTLGHVEAFVFPLVEMDGDREALRAVDLDDRVRAVGVPPHRFEGVEAPRIHRASPCSGPTAYGLSSRWLNAPPFLAPLFCPVFR